MVSTTEFRAECRALLGEANLKGDSILVTRRRCPVVVLDPAQRESFKSPCNSWMQKAEIIGDIVNLDTAGLWEVARRK